MIFNIVVICVFALICGVLAEKLKQSPIIGYILGGIIIGPYLTGIISDLALINEFADIGVILLMFTLGLEFSPARLLPVKSVAVAGGALEVLVMTFIGYILGLALGLSTYEAIFLGCVVSISSTMIVLRLLEDYGELHSLQGQVMLGILVVQDLAVVVMVSVLPALKDFSQDNIFLLLKSFFTAVVFVAIIMFLASKVIPKFMDRVARVENRDIFLLVALIMGLGVALVSRNVGLSLSLGAFMAGLAISESEYVHEIAGKIVSLKDIFVVIFFVSVGMMINPINLFQHLTSLIFILLVILLGKSLVIFFIVLLFKYHSRVALMVGMGMMQTGEFSFVLARLGLDRGLISESLYNLILASALISIVVTPFFMKKSSQWYNLIRANRIISPFLSREAPLADTVTKAADGHVILCGYGRMGSNVAWGLKSLMTDFFVVDYDYNVIRKLIDEGVPCVYGDASNEVVLKQLFPQSARAAVITIPDVYSSRLTILMLKKYRSDITIVARAHSSQQSQILYQAGATEVIQAEAEAGFQMIRHLILHLNIEEDNLSNYLGRLYYNDYRRIMKDKGYSSNEADMLRLRDFTINTQSPLIGKMLRESGIRESTGCNIVLIRRDGNILVSPTSTEHILVGDVLMMVGSDPQLKRFNVFNGGAGS